MGHDEAHSAKSIWAAEGPRACNAMGPATPFLKAVEEAAARIKVEMLGNVEDRKNNKALQGLDLMIDAHEKNMTGEDVAMMTIEEVVGTRNAIEDLL